MPPPLSKLQQKLRDRLMGGQFRHLNERLYTQTGAESFAMVRDDPTSYEAYHDGFRRQVRAWPVNPLDLIIAECAKLPAGSVVADFGCGDARLAATLAGPASAAPPRRLAVHSFDLHCPPDNPFVTACDMANVPLTTGTAAVAVFCLSLMGTNYAEFLREADRVLRPGGLLLVAEVRSRFAPAAETVAPSADKATSVEHASAGMKRPRGGAAPSAASAPLAEPAGGAAGSAADAAATSDGVDAFVRLVRAYGYRLALRDEANKMFVLLFFRKREAEAGGGGGGGKAAVPVARAAVCAPPLPHGTAGAAGLPGAPLVREPAAAAEDGSLAEAVGQRGDLKKRRRKKNKQGRGGQAGGELEDSAAPVSAGAGRGSGAGSLPPATLAVAVPLPGPPPRSATTGAPADALLLPPPTAAAAAAAPKKKRRRRGGHNAGSGGAGGHVDARSPLLAGGVAAAPPLLPTRPAPGVAPARPAAGAGGAAAARAPTAMPSAPVLKACTYKKR